MKTIWKFRLEVTDEQEVEAPIGMTPLSVQIQRGEPYLWALVSPEASTVMHTVHIHGTGHPVAERYADHFVGTFQQLGGAFVGHVFCKAIK